MLTPIAASQKDAMALMVRRAETAQMALHTAYRDPAGPGESLACMACEDSALFVITPDGRLVCDGCATAIGRYALRPEMGRS